ncbi:MAG: hypothetical protein WCV90_02350 [Candidatus Woesearchaeota archaeon]|jgi:hypothetical protein
MSEERSIVDVIKLVPMADSLRPEIDPITGEFRERDYGLSDLAKALKAGYPIVVGLTDDCCMPAKCGPQYLLEKLGPALEESQSAMLIISDCSHYSRSLGIGKVFIPEYHGDSRGSPDEKRWEHMIQTIKLAHKGEYFELYKHIRSGIWHSKEDLARYDEIFVKHLDLDKDLLEKFHADQEFRQMLATWQTLGLR